MVNNYDEKTKICRINKNQTKSEYKWAIFMSPTLPLDLGKYESNFDPLRFSILLHFAGNGTLSHILLQNVFEPKTEKKIFVLLMNLRFLAV